MIGQTDQRRRSFRSLRELDEIPSGFRATLTNGTPVTFSDVTGATSAWINPMNGYKVGLYDGGRVWVPVAIPDAGIQIPLGTLTSAKPYDVFGVRQGNSLVCDAPLAWTSDTARASAISRKNGIWVKSSDPTRRLLFCFYSTSTTATEDSDAKRYFYNPVNRVQKRLLVTDSGSHAYSTNSYRGWNNDTSKTYAMQFFSGLAEDWIYSMVTADVVTTVASAWGEVLVMLNSTSTSNSVELAHNNSATATFHGQAGCPFDWPPQLGYGYLQVVEAGGSGTSLRGMTATARFFC